MSACRDHPEREGIWHVSLPSIRVDFWRCAECELISQGVQSQYKGKREAWDCNADRDYQRRTYGTSDYDIGLDERQWK